MTTLLTTQSATDLPAESNAQLTIQKLSVVLQDKVILSALDLSLNEGDILGLVGASGCGKTTLLNAIAGFSKPTKGKIVVDGHLLSSNGLSDGEHCVPAEQRQVGMIFQDYALFPHLTVKENIAFGISKLSKIEQLEQIEQLLIILKLTDHSDSYIHQLSGGQQQRVAIARALAPKPKLLLLDEPFSNIDARLRNELMVEIRQLLKQFKTTAIFVTHNKDEVFTFADKMAVMAQGRLLQFDAPSIICQQPNSYQVADFLQLGSWLPCQVNAAGAQSLLGKLDIDNRSDKKDSLVYLLVKPANLLLNILDDENTNAKANAQVEYISVTEQGYHYYLSSLDDAATDKSMAFDKLSLYSDIALSLKQQVAVSIKPHDFLFFNNNH
ncbi:ABC transporter ATP-binding protein [Colwellia sp. 75C3]|uniref:ABC transporter ATP-binding protein n=1 Tax=Colwellia sp. 75C3 TaxID=888425 RepID=UPI000C31EFCA|nr:ABC transporter ATP-binding protein [Colwellia sp. 75C3]PKG86265.1 ABC transporter ATP-binding protein [Colwellia sp. 75C3]